MSEAKPRWVFRGYANAFPEILEFSETRSLSENALRLICKVFPKNAQTTVDVDTVHSIRMQTVKLLARIARKLAL